MPKRSNQFQRIVHVIVSKLAPSTATVRSCVELPERDSGTLREVDAVIEIGAGLSMVRVAVECRERGRRADVQWIDELIGKYSRLPIDRVVAVSSSGFSRAAQAKASSHNIDLVTPKQVTSTNWPERFARPQRELQFWWCRFNPTRLIAVTTQGIAFDVLPDDIVLEGPDGERKAQKATDFFFGLFDDIDKVMKERQNLDVETVSVAIREGKAEVLCALIVEDVVVGCNPAHIVPSCRGKQFPVKAFLIPVDVELNDRHDTVYATYGDALVGRLSFAGYDIATVQVPDGSPTVAVIEMPKRLRTDDDGTSKT
jgi:hypothetical protein